jgi:hypothetical protein
MSAPERAKGEYWIMLLAGVLLLGLGVGVAVAKFASPFPFAASPSPTPSAAPSRSASPTPTPDATASWTAYADTADKFSLRYPPTWQQRTCKVAGHTTLYLAPTADTLGVCNSGFGGQMSVGAQAGDQRSVYEWTAASGYASLVTTAVTVSGIAGIRQSATVSATSSSGPGPAVGSKIVQYIFSTNDRTYTFAYTQAPSAPDTLASFELMIKTTLTFTP